jgi:hypothetical protein
MLQAFGSDLGLALRGLAATGRVSHCEPVKPRARATEEGDGDEEDAEDWASGGGQREAAVGLGWPPFSLGGGGRAGG